MSVRKPSELTHLNADGHPHMVDVGDKPDTQREARVEAVVRLGGRAFELACSGGHRKGDVLQIARLAGIQGAKRASDLIPLCHPLPIDAVSIDIASEPLAGGGGLLRVLATVRTRWRTGVEMEAMTAASAAALTIYDMLKGTERGIAIESIRLIEKKGGRSGHWKAVTS
jgi:cyclic pyranopterin phosphate synthase